MLKIFVFIDIWFVNQDTINGRYSVFYGEFENEKKKKDKKILTFRSGDLNTRFSVIFPPIIWIFMWSEEPEIKSKQASKRDRTLPFSCRFLSTILWTARIHLHDECLCCKDLLHFVFFTTAFRRLRNVFYNF